MNKKQYIILILIIAVLSAYLILKKRDKVHYSLPVLTNLNKDSIVKLAIKKDKSEVSIKKDNTKWVITQDGTIADTAPVEMLLKEIENLTITSLVSETKDYAGYDLDEKNAIEVKAFDAGDNILRKIMIGKNAEYFGYTLVTIDDDYKVYHVKGALRNLFDKSAHTLRSRDVMSFNEEISEVTINDGKKEILIIKSPMEATSASGQKPAEEKKETKAKWLTKDGKPVIEKEIDEIISTLKSLRCENFIEGKKKEDLKDPIYTITLKGNKSYTITLFAKDGAIHQATSSENPIPFLLGEFYVNKIKKEISTLTEKNG